MGLPLGNEETRFVEYIAGRFAADGSKTFGAVEANGVLLVVVRANIGKAEQLREIVVAGWGGVIEAPRPKG